MNRQQKIAWFQLVVIAIAAVASVVNSGLYMQKYGYTFLKAWWFGTGWPVILCVLLVVLAPVFFRKKKGQINFDERDLIIDRRAARIGFGASVFFFIAVCATIWVAVGIDTAIPAYWLGRIILGGWLTAAVVHAITTVVCYNLGSKGEKS
jgi:uncharacterized membrane protein